MSLEYRIDHRGVVQVQAARQRNLCWPMLIVLLLLALVGGVWFYASGYLTPVGSGSGLQAISLRGKLNEQERLLAKQSEQIIQLESQSAAALRLQQVQESANDELRRKLAVLETELSEARQHLLLYQDILSPGDLEAGLHIQHIGFKQRVIDSDGKKLEHERYYQYHLVLAHIRGGEESVAGRFEIKLIGQRQGKKQTLTLQKEAAKNTTNPSSDRFSLKYYQSLEGTFELPAEFLPEQVSVSLYPDGGSGTVTKSYDWNAVNSSKKSTVSSKE